VENRIEHAQLRAKAANAQEAAALIQDGMTVAMGGYTSSGYPKVIAQALVKRKEAGEAFKINLVTGANVGSLDTMLARADLVNRRAPLIESKEMAQLVNRGSVCYIEQPMNRMPQLLRSRAFGNIDVAVIEAIKITKEGHVVPSSSVGMIQYFVDMADAVIIELNVAQPSELEGMHDIYHAGFPPNRKPIPLTGVKERIGEPFIRVDPEKVKYIVKSEILDDTAQWSVDGKTAQLLTANLLNFLELELSRQRRNRLPPLQTGFGNLADAIVRSLEKSNFHDLEFFCGILQEANMELVAKGKVKAASTGSIHMTPRVIELLRQHPQLMKETVVIRNNEITNNSEVISRLGPISLLSGIEVDIYGNVNVSHIGGNRVVNGIGGAANFAHNASLTIVLLPSETGGGNISTIVPMVTHHDICEHDVDVIITEHGVADLRGKGDVERAFAIIQQCAGSYKEQLLDYLRRAVAEVGGHHPHILSEVFAWHQRLKETGSMRMG
jgi:succinyl-CoA:acetate CoA-transferase